MVVISFLWWLLPNTREHHLLMGQKGFKLPFLNLVKMNELKMKLVDSSGTESTFTENLGSSYRLSRIEENRRVRSR